MILLEKVLVTGAGGLLGSKLVQALSQDYVVIPTHNIQAIHSNSVRMNIVDRDEVFSVLTQSSPEVVVHAAAETNVDKCEIDRERAWNLNAEGTRNVAMACSEIGAKLIYVSTDYVFDGGKGSYSEEDETDPVNYYGLTKLKGEESVKELCDGYAVARPCAVYGWHDRKLNFTTWVIDSLRKGRHIPVVEDHYDSPTFADELAEIIKMMIRKATGVYHTAGGERVNRYEFALRIAETFDLNRSLVSPVGMKEVKSWIAQRPRDSSLCMDKLRRDMHFHPSDLTQALEKMKKTQSE